MDKSGIKLDDPPIMMTRYRREGFPGQHHVVLPTPIITAAREHNLLSGLFVTDAGKYPSAEGHRVRRPEGTSGAILIVCTAGCGWVESKDQHRDVTAGDVVLIGPDESHAYGADAEDPWTIEWAHFSGRETHFWREAIVGNEFFLHLHSTTTAGLRLARVHEHLEAGYDEVQLLMASVTLRRCLTELVKFCRVPGHAPTSVEAVEATAEWMRGHLSSLATLAVLAKMAGMSASRYSDIFKQRFGYSPIDWFMRQRVQEACHLLDVTTEKVEVVGMEVGFKDPYYFSRCFRKVMGCSPRTYRAIQKG